jgi:PAS domain S-box-containing protein
MDDASTSNVTTREQQFVSELLQKPNRNSELTQNKQIIIRGKKRPEHSRLASSLTARYSDWVLEALDELPGSFLLTDPSLAGHPIVYASRGLAALTGYPRREVLGRNARVFQGAATARAAVAGVREAVRAQRPHQVAILNYRRDGSPHWVLLHLAPVFRARDGTLLHFLAVQVPIDAAAKRRAGPAPCRGATGAVLAACREEARVDEDFPCASHAGKVFVDMDKRGQCDLPVLVTFTTPLN